MEKDYESMSVAEQIKAGLEDSLAYTRGELTLKTTVLPEPPPQVQARDVTRLRKGFSMSQAVFAAALNVSPKTVQSWEQGEKEPSHVALRMLQLLKQEPKVIKLIFAGPGGSARWSVTRTGTGPLIAKTRRAAAAKKRGSPGKVTRKAVRHVAAMRQASLLSKTRTRAKQA